MLTLPDRKCVDLATHFLPDDEGDRIWSLALEFQEVVEDFCLKECETVPVQKSGLETAKHDGGTADTIQREGATITIQCSSCQMFDDHDPECSYHPNNI